MDLRMFNRLLLALPYKLAYEGAVTEEIEETETEEPPVTPPVAKKKVIPPTFDESQQAYINSLLADEKRKAKKKNDELITQLETKKNEHGTTAAEKEALETRIDSLKSEFHTKEEIKGKEHKKKLTEAETRAQTAESKAKAWETRFQEKTITVELTAAAIDGKAFNANQVVTILKPNTRLVEVLDDDNKPTGEFVPKVKLPTKDKEGKVVVLEFTATEAVKQLQDNPEEYGNLFISGAAGGLGATTLAGRKTGSKPNPADMNTEDYVAARKAAKKK